MTASDDSTLGADAAAETLTGARRRSTDASRTRIGRFVVLERLGAGGMATVYAAYDDHLDRRIAVKVMRQPVGPGTGRQRMLREAQAMAQLSHPNVLQIFEAGEHDGQLYIAMEFVSGQDLDAWARARRPGWKEILAVYVRAGRGLAAAHDAGIVHRDFKPHNVMIDARRDDDGMPRVRVMDFGLAGGARRVPSEDSPRLPNPGKSLDTPITESGSILGTPAFMAPEQISAAQATPATDQFSFCVSVWGALFDRRPFAGDSLPELFGNIVEGRREQPALANDVPSWVRATLDRGLQIDPTRRWPDMRSLLAELERDRERGRRRAVLVAGGVAVVGVTSLVVSQLSAPSAACEESAIAEVWSQERREAVARALSTIDVGFAEMTAGRIVEDLDAYAAEWNEARRAVCVASTDASGTNALERNRCLDARLRGLEALVTVLEQADEAALEHAPRAVAALPAVASCHDPLQLAAEPPVPDDPSLAAAVDAARADLDRARSLRDAGQARAALDTAEDALARAGELAFDPLDVEAHDVVGQVLLQLADFDGALAHGRAAYARSGRTSVVEQGRNLRLLASTHGRVGDLEANLAELEKARVVLGDAFGLEHLRLAEVRNDLGLALLDAARYEAARVELEAALRIREQWLEPEHLDIATSRDNLATLMQAEGDYADALGEHRRALEVRVAALGPDHPASAASINNVGAALAKLGRHAEALEQYERSLAIRERIYGTKHPAVAHAYDNVASGLGALGKREEALRFAEHALALRTETLGPAHPDTAQNRNQVGFHLQHLGRYSDALAQFELALASTIEVYGPDHPDAAFLYNNIGAVLDRLGRSDEALRSLDRALAVREKTLGPDHPDVAVSLDNLATLERQRGRPDEALALHRRALAIREKLLPPAHPDIADSYDDIGLSLGRLGEIDAAIESHRKALELFAESLPPDHTEVAFTLSHLGAVLRAKGLFDEALAVHRRALEMFSSPTRPDDERAAAHLQVGADLAGSGAFAEAVTELREAISILEHSEAQSDIPKATARLALAAAGGDLHDEARSARAKYEASFASRTPTEVEAATLVLVDHVVLGPRSERSAVARARETLRAAGEWDLVREADRWLVAR